MCLPTDFGQRPEGSGSRAEDMRRNLIQRAGRSRRTMICGSAAWPAAASVREATVQLRDGARVEAVLAAARRFMVWLSGAMTAPDVLERRPG